MGPKKAYPHFQKRTDMGVYKSRWETFISALLSNHKVCKS